MKAQTLFYIIIAIVIFNYALSRFLEYLNSRHYGDQLPEEVKDVYDSDQYKKSQQYKIVNYKFSILTSTLTFLLILGMFFFRGFAFVDNIARSLTSQPILLALIFFGIIMLASDLIHTPFSIYDVFVIEEKFGFNKMTVKTFILDKIKGWLLGGIIGGGILSAVIWFYQQTTDYFWLIAWIFVSLFSIFMTMFYSTLIVPIFNKQTPLEEGELRDKIMSFSEKVGFKLKNIYVIDGSKRSTKANAYFSGLGPKKRIVLYDTLIADLKPDEITAVLAHEIGHYKKKHTLSGTILSVVQSGIILYIFSLFVANPLLSEALGVKVNSFHIALITFGFLYSPISMALGLGLNVLSRNHEYQADHFAGVNYNPGSLINALKSLSRKNLSNLTPHPVYVWFNYSHPTLVQRIRALLNIRYSGV
jgi:STE24 endopeptidase